MILLTCQATNQEQKQRMLHYSEPDVAAQHSHQMISTFLKPFTRMLYAEMSGWKFASTPPLY